MNHRLKFVVIALLVLTVATLIADPYRTKAQLKSMSAWRSQAQDRIVRTKEDFSAPIKIVAVKTKLGEIKMDKEFLAADDWLKGLTVRLVNHSGRRVTFVEVLIIFWRTEDQTPGQTVGWPLKAGINPFSPDLSGQLPMQPAVPGDEIELILSDAKYVESKRFLKAFQFPDAIKKVELKLIAIGFDDDTAWYSGRMYRREATNIGEPSPIEGWVPIREPDKEKPQGRYPTGSARNRTAFSVRANVLDVEFGVS